MVCEKIRFSLLESGWTKPWCPGMVSRPSAKAYEPLARSRGYTTGTVFIKGPSIVLPVWRCIMFNGSYLRACLSIVLLVWRCIMFNDSFLRVCRILWFVKKLDFPFLSLGGPSHGARVWCLGQVPKHRNQWQEVEGSGKK